MTKAARLMTIAGITLLGCLPAVTANATPASTIPGDGVYQVGVDVAPGTYKTPGTSGGMCSWMTYASLGSSSDMIDGNASTGQLYAQIPSAAAAFETHGCLPWVKVS